MRPTVLIIEDSRSTAHLARMALAEEPCEVVLATSATGALEMVRDRVRPRVMVVDAHLPGVPASPFLSELRAAAPAASLILLLDRGVVAPLFPTICAQLYKPLQPRRLRTVVLDIILADPPGTATLET